jgi:hypothetical protein
MARTFQEIRQQMDDEQSSQPELSGLTNQSATAIHNVWKDVVARCIWVLENLWDRKKAEIEEVLSRGGVGSTKWVIQKCFEFQYDAVTPQVVQLFDNFVPRYPVIDPSKRIITRAKVINNTGTADVRVAKGNPPQALSTAEKNALQAYFTGTGNSSGGAIGIGMAGQHLVVNSYAPDLLFLQGNIYYKAAYMSTIQNAVIDAINAYITDPEENGVVNIQKLDDKIKAVTGVNDIIWSAMSGRAATASFPGTAVIAGGIISARGYNSVAGYLIGETTTGETFADKLTFIGE